MLYWYVWIRQNYNSLITNRINTFSYLQFPPPFPNFINFIKFSLLNYCFDPTNSIRATVDNRLNIMAQTPCSLWNIQCTFHKNLPTIWVTLRLTSGWPLDLEQEVSLLHNEKRQTLPRDEITTDPGSSPNTHVCLTWFAFCKTLIYKYGIKII